MFNITYGPLMIDAPQPKILDSILEQIGNTPMVRINKLGARYGVDCEIGGSIKDRIAKRMVEEAEKAGKLKLFIGDEDQKTTIVEPTSGNTGIGLAMAAAVKDYGCIICLPEKMSREKVDTMRALGAKIIQTPTEVSSDHPASHMSIARQLTESPLTDGNTKAPTAPLSFFMPDQYTNPGNPLAHYEDTGPEIWEACGGNIDVVVMGAGTGGTISGVGRFLKEKNPNIMIVGVDPVGSILANGSNDDDTGKPYLVEGIGYDFIPKVFDSQVVDRWIKVDDRQCFRTARELIKEEAILCGGSSGGAMWAALQVAQQLRLGPTQRMVVIFPDSLRNYMSKFLSDDWMLIHDFIAPKEYRQLTGLQVGSELEKVSWTEMVKGRRIPVVNENQPTIALQGFLDEHEIIAVRAKDSSKIIGYVPSATFSAKYWLCGPTLYKQAIKRHLVTEFKMVDSSMSLPDVVAYASTGFPVFLMGNDKETLVHLRPCDFLSISTDKKGDL